MVSKRVIAVAAVALALVGASAARAGAWIPGTPYNASEKDVRELMERKFDYAYCTGIARFGKWQLSEYDFDAEYRILDCRVRVDDTPCGVRVRVVKGAKRDFFRVVFVRFLKGQC